MSNEADRKEEGVWISPLSEFQVQYLRGLFLNEDERRNRTKITRIATTSEGSLVIEYLHNGQLKTDMITRHETMESFREKNWRLMFKTPFSRF